MHPEVNAKRMAVTGSGPGQRGASWQGKTVLVTGGTRGIGQQMVRQLIQAGARVVSTGQSTGSVASARNASPTAEWIACDLADSRSRAALLEALQQHALDVVIHNAGVQQERAWAGTPGLVDSVEISVAREIDINLMAPIELTRQLLPALALRPDARIVFVTSGLALAPKSASPVYCATKAGLRSFAKALRGQLRACGSSIQVIEALPPLVDTDMTRGRGKGKISAEAAARKILAGVAAGRPEVDVGMTRLLRAIMRLSPALGETIMIGK